MKRYRKKLIGTFEGLLIRDENFSSDKQPLKDLLKYSETVNVADLSTLKSSLLNPISLRGSLVSALTSIDSPANQKSIVGLEDTSECESPPR